MARSYVQQDLAPGTPSIPRTRAGRHFAARRLLAARPHGPRHGDRDDRGGRAEHRARGHDSGRRAEGVSRQLQGRTARPGVNDFTNFPAVHDALVDALADGMDVVTLSMTEGDPSTFYGPLDNLPECGGACDVYSEAVETAIRRAWWWWSRPGTTATSAFRPQTLNTIHRPGDAPSAITVGRADELARALPDACGSSGRRTIRALFGDGPHAGAP